MHSHICRRIAHLTMRRLKNAISRRKKPASTADAPNAAKDGNPYLPFLREIMEQILEKRNISYAQFSPIFIDGDDSKAPLLAAELLGRDLNRLTILTNRPAYFEEYADNMYEEQGLIAEFLPKNRETLSAIDTDRLRGNVILDFEPNTTSSYGGTIRKKLYLPVFKRPWEDVGDLDIMVPIGYNTMTVRIRQTVKKPSYSDKFERAFYENE